MYTRRLKVFIVFCAVLLGLALLRLVQMQLLSISYYRGCIAELRKNKSRQLSTVRGRIIDRKGRVLAQNEPQFQLCVDYKLAILADGRFRQARRTGLNRGTKEKSAQALENLEKEIQDGLEALQDIVGKCAAFYGIELAELEDRVRRQNNLLWARRAFLAWRRNCRNSDLLKRHSDIESVRLSEALADFKTRFLYEQDRFSMISAVPVADLQPDESWLLVDLKTDDDVLAAQLEFMDTKGVEVVAHAARVYPYSLVAAQTIGWVGPLRANDERFFSGDRLKTYLEGELYGRGGGVEYVCEAVLRGRRGEIVYNFDDELIQRTDRQFGKDVFLTLDIELQKRIEEYLDSRLSSLDQRTPARDSQTQTSAFGVPKKRPTSAVVIDVASGDIVALVSLPGFDLNRIRIDYAGVAGDPNEPLRNRAINQRYPPGSVIKPLILIAGLEGPKITAEQVIPCPSHQALDGWPDCWIFNKHRIGHDILWENNARNAIKGSCNIYFSQLAERIEPSTLQSWLFKFGYGRRVLAPPGISQIQPDKAGETRNFVQLAGVISSDPEETNVTAPDQLSALLPPERRLFGIGQANLRVTPLQVANAMAIIARGGLYKPPRLVSSYAVPDAYYEERNTQYDIRDTQYDLVDLNISPQTLAIVRSGMRAVVNEPRGTAYKEFVDSGFEEQDVTIYGKTGSTEKPDNAWFAGFAEDSRSRSIAIAVVVEGGQHGSQDAGPLARDIIQFCIEAGYIGEISN